MFFNVKLNFKFGLFFSSIFYLNTLSGRKKAFLCLISLGKKIKQKTMFLRQRNYILGV